MLLKTSVSDSELFPQKIVVFIYYCQEI